MNKQVSYPGQRKPCKNLGYNLLIHTYFEEVSLTFRGICGRYSEDDFFRSEDLFISKEQAIDLIKAC